MSENEENQADIGTDEEIEEEKPPIKVKKRKRKAKIISEMEPEADEERLLLEITNLLKKARIALVKKNYIEAVICYQDAGIAANMAGDTERERLFLRRANEILQDHPELKEDERVKIIKRRKIKAMVRPEEKFSLVGLISNMIAAVLFIILIYSGLISAIFLMDIVDMTNYTLVWGLSIAVEILGLTLAYLLATRFLRWSKRE
ncbi:MAG: hypothetical protein HWN65_21215 [Candidatus Helarchaeota archaeon]|nr:hypothetical protein [Candidatus Helarchaeota archaeon]